MMLQATLSSRHIAPTLAPTKNEPWEWGKKDEWGHRSSASCHAGSSREVRQLCGRTLTQQSIPECHEISKGPTAVAFKHSTWRGDEAVMGSFHPCVCLGAKISDFDAFCGTSNICEHTQCTSEDVQVSQKHFCFQDMDHFNSKFSSVPDHL